MLNAGQPAQAIPFEAIGLGKSTEFGKWISPYANAVFVSSAGYNQHNPQAIAKNTVRSLADALNWARSGRFDCIFVDPNHAEDVADGTMLNDLRPGTRIVGLGNPVQGGAQFTFTAATSAWVLNDANVSIANLRIDLGAAASANRPFEFGAENVAFYNCRILAGNADEIFTFNDNSVDNPILIGNYVTGGAAGCNAILSRGSTGVQGAIIRYNHFRISSSAALMAPDADNAARLWTDWDVADNTFINAGAGGIMYTGATWAAAAHTGNVNNNRHGGTFTVPGGFHTGGQVALT